MENTYCKKCGEHILGSASYCRICGASTSNSPRVQRPVRAPAPGEFQAHSRMMSSDQLRLYKQISLDSRAQTALIMVIISYFGGSLFTAIPAFIMAGRVLEEDPYNSTAGMARKLSAIVIVLSIVLLIVVLIIISGTFKTHGRF